MKRTIEIRLRLPLVPRANFDVITQGLEAAANDFSLQDLDRLLSSGKTESMIVHPGGCFTVEYVLND